MLSNQPDQPDHVDRGQNRWGCLPVFLIGFCACLLVVVGTVGASISYSVGRAYGIASTPASIGGAVVAFVVVCLTSPIGFAIYWLFLPEKSTALARSFFALLAATLGAIIHAPVILVFAALSAIAGAFLFRWCEPMTAAILTAIVFPLVGLITGIIVGDPEGDQ